MRRVFGVSRQQGRIKEGAGERSLAGPYRLNRERLRE